MEGIFFCYSYFFNIFVPRLSPKPYTGDKFTSLYVI